MSYNIKNQMIDKKMLRPWINLPQTQPKSTWLNETDYYFIAPTNNDDIKILRNAFDVQLK